MLLHIGLYSQTQTQINTHPLFRWNKRFRCTLVCACVCVAPELPNCINVARKLLLIQYHRVRARKLLGHMLLNAIICTCMLVCVNAHVCINYIFIQSSRLAIFELFDILFDIHALFISFIHRIDEYDVFYFKQNNEKQGFTCHRTNNLTLVNKWPMSMASGF